MSILIEHGVVGLAEADHRIANNLASLSGVIRLQRNAISKSGKTFTAGEGCGFVGDNNARHYVTAKNPKNLGVSHKNKGGKLRGFFDENGGDVRTLGPAAGRGLRH